MTIHLVAPSTLPPAHFSVLSYNVLLPNSIDGWWNYKMYDPSQPMTISEWDYRRQLLKDRIATLNADIVCLQEVCPISFEDDFSFMQDLGYLHSEIFRKGRFRPATFWKSHLELAAPPVHKDRTLLTTFTVNEQNVYILNCHLQAGPQAPRRLRQINEGVRAVGTLSRKLKDKEPRLVVCGDFNGGEECGAVRFLEDGEVDTTFIEDGEPVTSSGKECPFGKLHDVTKSVNDRDPPPTMVVNELISVMVDGEAYENPRLSKTVKDRLERIYNRFANESGQMATTEVEKWLIQINGKVGRGSEFRSAARQMGWKESEDLPEGEKERIELPANGVLTLDGFTEVYEEELRQGKFWGIAYDLSILGEPLPDAGLYKARFDRMYHTPTLETAAVVDFLCDQACPNEIEPSDHLPVAAAFNIIGPN